MSSLREYAGRSWSEWVPPPEPDIGDYSDSPSPVHSARHSNTPTPTEVTPNSSRSHSPIHRSLTPTENRALGVPPTDDVMKLPRKDMHIFGLCPVQGKIDINAGNVVINASTPLPPNPNIAQVERNPFQYY